MPDLTPAQLTEGRKFLCLTQAAAATSFGTTQACVARYESGARKAPEHYVRGLREACELKARPPVPVVVAPAVAGFDIGSLKAIGKNADQIAKLPERDFESLRTRINEVISSTYDEKLKVRGLDILAKLELARAKVGGMPGDVPAPTEGEAYSHMADLSDRELAVMAALDQKARGEVFTMPTPGEDLTACLAWLAGGGTTQGIERAGA